MSSSSRISEFEKMYFAGDIQILRETTKWETPTPNHIYYINRSERLMGYKPVNGKRKFFKKPLPFYKARRKFHIIKDFGEVVSRYETSLNHCTCKGFLYRKMCRHVNELRRKSNG